MLFLIASSPDTKEFKTAYRTAKEMEADICLLQNAVYAARNGENHDSYVLIDDMKLRGLGDSEVSAQQIDYSQLVELMTSSDKVVGLF